DMQNHWSLDRIVADYVAGMTDRYAISLFYDMYIPSPWRNV
ncbi:MAG: deoxyguanosinetriphosphate triphosphohydrolase, partial [Hyphomonadaceae bacterium]|nr:deoxyguanosinetriphosphate triphosphohydrolase [Clostridia bacterium]